MSEWKDTGHTEWDEMRDRINKLHTEISQKPDSEKMGYAFCPGGILNAYREGDISFCHAVLRLNDLIEARDAAIRKECADREAQLLDAAKAFQELATCYRIGKRPTEKLFARLEKANAAIMGKMG